MPVWKIARNAASETKTNTKVSSRESIGINMDMAQVVAIAGDADMYHVDCARAVYGNDVVDRLTSDDTVELAFTEDWPKDSEGNDLIVVPSDSEDLTDETGQPCSCGHCLGYLVEDERASDSPLARDIFNLSVAYRDEQATKVLSTLAHAAKEWDTKPDYLVESAIPYYESLREQDGEEGTRPRAALRAISLMQDWRATWLIREIVTLRRNESGMLVDSDGNEWTEYDMRGYLGMYDDGESSCESCGRRVASHCFYCVWDSELYCPDCVTIA